MKIYNAFGITPTNTFLSAGSDYYIPNLDTPEKIAKAYKAFEKSYGKTEEEINDIINTIENYLSTTQTDIVNAKKHIPNIVHLYLAFHNKILEAYKSFYVSDSISRFLSNNLVYDTERDIVGVRCELNDTLFINSGIKIALDSVLEDQTIYPNRKSVIDNLKLLGIGIAGLYVNKSGKGNAGFDVRACLVDEDYSGYVHLSMAYTKDLAKNGPNIVYCGDKLTQMMLIPIFHTNYEEIDEDEYNKIMSDSNRGDNGFGSSDIKH